MCSPDAGIGEAALLAAAAEGAADVAVADAAFAGLDYAAMYGADTALIEGGGAELAGWAGMEGGGAGFLDGVAGASGDFMYPALDAPIDWGAISGGLESAGSVPVNVAPSGSLWDSLTGLVTSPVMMGVSTAGSILSGVTGYMGAQQSAAAQSAAAQYQARIAEVNRQIAMQNAQASIEKGEFNSTQAGMKTKANVGAIAAQQGANGLDINSGSNVDVRSSAAQLGQLDQLSIRTNSQREADSYTAQAGSYGMQAGLDRMQAAGATSSGGINAMSSLIGGGTSAASNWVKWNLAGV